jgi:hypothetical protein
MKIQCFADGAQLSAYTDRPEYKISLRFDKVNLPGEWLGDHLCDVRAAFKDAISKEGANIFIVVE